MRKTGKLVQSPAWFLAFVLSIFLCSIVFLANAIFFEVHPATTWGIAYGTAAALMMTGAALWGIRRRTMSFAPGRSQAWVQFHVYGGTIFLILVLMHTGFRLPTGTLAWWLFACALWVFLTGIGGVFLQKTIPRILTSGLSMEVHSERIPELIEELRQRSETLVAGCTDSIQDFYRQKLAPAFAGPRPKWIYFLDITGGIHSSLKQFDYLKRFLSVEEKDKLNVLQSYYKAKLEIDAHFTLQRILRVWLYLHVPVSIVLLLLVGLHLFSVFYF
jgi:hypothetical protein